MSYKREITNVSPYWDDFESYRNFMRILFNPSRPVQARELTQMQTFAQSQLETVAQHLFKDGSPIIGAKVEVTKDSPYIEILASDVYELAASPSTPISNVQDLVGQHIQAWSVDSSVTSGTLAKVIAVDNNSGTLRIQLDYRGGEFQVGDRFASVNYSDDDITEFPQKYQSNNVHISAVGSGIRARVEAGKVWINGFFVDIPVQQEIFVNKVDTSGTYVIGYEFEEVTLTANDSVELDPVDGVTFLGDTLKDPAGSSNNSAPGADRYMVRLSLRSYEVGVDIIPDQFHQVIRISDGVVEEKLEKVQYADILNLLAGRTYDESGSYTVEPFSLLATKLDAENFNYEVGPGRAYIFGFERENLSPVKLPATKTRIARSVSSGIHQPKFGTYVEVRTPPESKVFDVLGTGIIVDTNADIIKIPEHGFGPGDKVVYNNGTGNISGLTNGGEYYVIVVDKDRISLALTPADATNGVVFDIAGGVVPGTGHSFTPVDQIQGSLDPTELQTVYMMTGYSGSGSVIAKARAYYVNTVNGRPRVYLGDDPELLTDLQSCRSLCSVDTGAPGASDAYMNINAFDVKNNIGFNQPIVELAGSYVKEVTGVNYPTLIKIGNKSVTSGAGFTLATGSPNDKFQGGSDAEDAVALIVNVDGTNIDFASNTIDAFGTNPTGGGTSSITADSDHDLPTGNYDFFMLINRESATPRTKTLTEPSFFDVTIGGAAVDRVVLNGTDNDGALTGPAATFFDVADIESIVRDPSGANEDITSFYTLDDGQKDLYYDYSAIQGPFLPNQTYRIKVHHWAWSGTGDFFAANSYVRGVDSWFDDKGGVEANIPVFRNQALSKSYVLRDCLDFRRNITEINTPREIVEPLGTLEVTYEYYLPRRDKIWLDRDGKLGVTQGIPEESPVDPPDRSGTMTLFNTYVAPYIYGPEGQETAISSDQVNIQIVDQKNYTMNDIRRLENRIRGLEAYASESQLELDSYADTVLDKNGLSRSKNGIFVDRFNGHTKANVWDPNHRCSMDEEEGVLHCPFEMNHIQFEYDSTPAASGVQTNVSEESSPWRNTITLQHTPALWVEQPLATEFMNINPFAVSVWAGEMVLTPASDTWVDTVYAPALQVQDPAEAAKIRALYEREDVGIPNWNAWQRQVIGTRRVAQIVGRIGISFWRNGVLKSGFTPIVRSVNEDITAPVRTGTILEQTGTRTIEKDMGERIIDVSRIPWMRTIDIAFEATGLRPDTVVIPYFAEQDVSANVVWDVDYPGGKTDQAGNISGVFTVPAQTFRTGKNVFSLQDRVNDPLTVSSTEFHAEGTLNTLQKDILSVEVPTYTTREIREQGQASDSRFPRIRWKDPIAQTILVEDVGGVFLESIDIFFATKDRYLPVTLMIVETIAGVPGPRIVPYSQTTVQADDVIATYWDELQAPGEELRYRGNHYDSNGTNLVHADGDEVTSPAAPTDFAPTKFSFSDPIYLKEGVEYAFVLLSNSNNYNAYISRMGNFDIISGNGVVKQPHLGSLLKSQNTSTWTPDQYADIKFRINRCEFDDSPSTLYMRTRSEFDYWDDIVYAPGENIIFNHSVDGLNVYTNLVATVDGNGEDPESAPTKWRLLKEGFYDATKLNISLDDLVLPETSIGREYLSDPDTTWIPFTNKEDINITEKDTIELYTEGLPQNPTEPKGLNLKLTLATENTWLSPVINKGRSFGVLINNLVRLPDAEDLPLFSPNWDAGEYISETTILKENASTLKLLIDVARPNENARIVPKYRTVKEDLRYVERDPNLASGENDLSVQDLKDEFVNVYWLDDNLGVGNDVTDVQFRGEAVVDGIDVDNARIYMSSISDPSNFGDNTYLGTQGLSDPWILMTIEPDLHLGDLHVWDYNIEYVQDDYVLDVNKNLYRALVTTTAIPSFNSTDWLFIPSALVKGNVQFDTETEWRPMVEVSDLNPAIDTRGFIEYEFEPLATPSEEFDNFAIKIEMYSDDEVNVPECKRLRVIAVQ